MTISYDKDAGEYKIALSEMDLNAIIHGGGVVAVPQDGTYSEYPHRVLYTPLGEEESGSIERVLIQPKPFIAVRDNLPVRTQDRLVDTLYDLKSKGFTVEDIRQALDIMEKRSK